MASIPVTQVKPGTRLAQDVVTKRGNLLFNKGRMLYKREIDILQAFFIPSIEIEGSAPKAAPNAAQSVEETQQQALSRGAGGLQTHYEQMIPLVKALYVAANMAQELPILQIRKQLEVLIQDLDQYNPLTFVPRNYQLEDFFYHQAVLVGLTAYQLAKWNDFAQKDLVPIALAGLIHDVGTIKVDPAVVAKSGKYNREDFEEMKRHATLGYNMLQAIPTLNEGIKMAVLQHHEREDSSGYPMGLSGYSIHPYAKIVAIADVFHAMNSKRRYREAISPYLVLEQLLADSFGKLNPVYVQMFIRKVTQFHNGSMVRLSNGAMGEIIFTDSTHPTRPWVNLGDKIVNLSIERQLYIEEVL